MLLAWMHDASPAARELVLHPDGLAYATTHARELATAQERQSVARARAEDTAIK